jgi:hypothetical protein
VTDEAAMKEALQPLIRDQMMRTWREGMRDGLLMAGDMAAAVRAELVHLKESAKGEEGRQFCDGQMAVLDGLMSGISAAAEAMTAEEAL